MRRVLLTGGAGCLGSNLVEHFLCRGDTILVLDNFATSQRDALPPDHPCLTVIEGSIADVGLVDQTFVQFGPTHIVHCAASYKDPDNWEEDAATNVTGMIAVARAAEKAGVRRFLNFHTSLGYGRPDRLPIPVDAPSRPFTSYGISKQTGEDYLAMSNLPWVSFRLATVAGPRLAIGPIPTFYTRLKAGKACFCSRTMRDFMDMEDFLDITERALAADAPVGRFNVTTGTGHTIREIFRLVAGHLGLNPDMDVPEVDPGPDDVPAVVLDPSATTAAFGWRPRYGFEEIIRRVLAWYDAHGVTTIYSHVRAPTSVGAQAGDNR